MADTHSSPMQSASAGTSSSTINHQPPAPNYLSAKSADTILSEVRPTRIKSEALRSVNVLLDELLWLILGHARSFSTDRLRSGLLKMLSTVLGKSALLEAEVELRAYLARNPPVSPLPSDEIAMQKFPLQPAFELLRMKCEAYSSLGDQEEDPQMEAVLHARMVQATGEETPKIVAIAPAALYLTAILEHVCEHVLSNVGRVVARDSSRTTAHSQDLYVALCEDESIYPLFKTMKVQEQIEQQSKMVRPSRRSKSSSRIDAGGDAAARATSPDAPIVPSKSRPSLESAISAGSSNQPNRSSIEKARNKVLFRAGSNAAESRGNGMSHRRSNSLLGDKKAPTPLPQDTMPSQDEDAAQDFDDLMRSGTTMKVSLTPDRLKTFEVFAKEKTMRANRPVKESSVPPSSFTNSPQSLQRTSQPSRTRLQVEPIAEAPEVDTSRVRAASISTPTEGKTERPSSASRPRSFTDTRSPIQAQPSTKVDLSAMPVPISEPPAVPRKNARRGPVRNRESLDLDDIMNGVEDEEEELRPKKLILTPKDAKTTSETKDLLDFLSEGPPEPPPTAPINGGFGDRVNVNKQGRFRAIVSRLTGSSSNEKLTPKPVDDLGDSVYRPGAANLNGNSRPKPGSLHAKRSAPNVATLARPLPLPNPSHSQDASSSSSGGRSRHASMTRKAVPPWDAATPIADLPSQARTMQVESATTTKPLPRQYIPSTSDANAVESISPVSPSRKRVPQYEVPTNIHGDSKPSSPISSASIKHTNGHTGHIVVQDIRKPSSLDGSQNEKQIPPVRTITIPTEEYVRDFQHLMARATSPDECRLLVDMFLARCGIKFEKDATPIQEPSSFSTVGLEGYQEANLVEALLGEEVWHNETEAFKDSERPQTPPLDAV